MKQRGKNNWSPIPNEELSLPSMLVVCKKSQVFYKKLIFSYLLARFGFRQVLSAKNNV